MKSKVLVSLLLALIMLFTLAAPALAGKPEKVDEWTYWSGSGWYATSNITGYAKLQVTHDNQLKLTVVVAGLTEGDQYVFSDGSFGFIWGSDEPATVNKRGVLKFTDVTTGGFTSGAQHRVTIREYPSLLPAYQSNLTPQLYAK